MNWQLAWQVFIGAAVIGFTSLETGAITTEQPGQDRNTLSANLRRWMGIKPQAPRRWWTRLVFLGFLTWFEVHILTSWW